MLATLNKPNNETIELFARITPIVGDNLTKKHIAIVGELYKETPQAFQIATFTLLEYLVSCGVINFSCLSLNQKHNPLFTRSLKTISKRLNLKVKAQVAKNKEDLICKNLDLIIGTGGYKAYEQTKNLVKASNKQGVFYLLMANGSGLVIFLTPNKLPDIAEDIFAKFTCKNNNQSNNVFSQLHLVNIVASYAKGLLLKGTSHARLDIESLVNSSSFVIVGHPSWPWAIKPMNLEELVVFVNSFLEISLSQISQTSNSLFPSMLGKICLVVGLGSLGSVVAKTLSQLGANLVLVDGENVDLANPIRQIYGIDQIGQAKSDACLKEVSKNIKNTSQKIFSYKLSISPAEESILQLESLLAIHNIDVAIVATGTGNDRIISQTLVSKKVPHIVVSCYARARFFEAIVVDAKGGPCFGCLRGHLYLGKTPSLTPEQRARYISLDHDLAAEPATRIETGRAADLAAHIAYGLLNLDKTTWLSRALAENKTFFLGGNASEQQKSKWVYNIELPGEVRLFGLQDIAGRGDYIECWDCGRKLPVLIHHQVL